jgi:Potential Queuosine, Q, salvage protein family
MDTRLQYTTGDNTKYDSLNSMQHHINSLQSLLNSAMVICDMCTQMDERVLKVRELGAVLKLHFNGLAANMVVAANHSAVNVSNSCSMLHYL